MTQDEIAALHTVLRHVRRVVVLGHDEQEELLAAIAKLTTLLQPR